jgi:CheY-like chemotaxis protein/signal transduction histidine kinase
MGDLADSFKRMINVTEDYSRFAEQIGQGDYSAVLEMRSEWDVLGKSLNSMKENLQRLSKENEVRTWLLTGNGEINDIVRGEKDVSTLAQEVINRLTTYLKAHIGAIYLMESGKLNLRGTYAFHSRKNNANSFAIGEGFVGQAALERKPIFFNEVPESYVKINSGLGNVVPSSIVVYPFINENELKGVVEIGSTKEFSELDLQLLQMVGATIAIAFHAAQSRDRMKQLLEETQRQAEELEAQQEELKQSNEELIEKTELLEKSESELKTQQEELQQINEELEEKANLLEEQKQVLESAKMQIENKARELETTSKYKSEFLANMSHELRTPLNSILILSQILIENKSNILTDREVQFATNIYNSGADLLNLINEILDLSKVESGRIDIDITEFPVEELMEDMEMMFREVAQKKLLDYKTQVSDSLTGHKIQSDEQRIKQILKNLLSNSFKFTDQGGEVKLTVDIVKSGVSFGKIELREASAVIAFSVSDTGIGIPEEKWGVVFEAFQQVDGSTKRKYGGTGLGLSISRELAHALGGEIHLKSKETEGSIFTLYLPLHAKLPISNHGLSKEISDGRLKETFDTGIRIEKILPPDEDDTDFAQTLLAFVRERHYKGIIAHEGNTGLSYARHYKPDAILLDMKLPVMNGSDVLMQLKKDPELRHIPVQIISGFDLKKEGMELGAFDFIRKPVSKETLWNALDKIEDFVTRKVKKLLVIEDDKQHNDAVKQLIGNGDVKCFSAYSGKEAYEMLLGDSFDCIIIDLGLPDMTGFDLLEKIKVHQELARIPIVIYTGKDLTREESNKLDKLGSTVVLKTAFSHERLLDETMLFLHRIESKLPKEKQNIIRKLHKTDEVLKNKKVLVVDDDIRNVYSLTSALEEEGLQCLIAENGKEALAILKQEPHINLVLMDVMMPEMDGYEATKSIRKMAKFKKLPIIALTAKAMKGDREKCLTAGMSDYISKPLNIQQLLSLMRVWLYQ